MIYSFFSVFAATARTSLGFSSRHIDFGDRKRPDQLNPVYSFGRSLVRTVEEISGSDFKANAVVLPPFFFISFSLSLAGACVGAWKLVSEMGWVLEPMGEWL